jgi:hypothetical protein
MNTRVILEALDSEIGRLQQARNALAGLFVPNRRGRHKVGSVAPVTGAKRSPISAAGRKSIADAQRKRWAKQRAVAKKATGKRIAKKIAKKAITNRPAKRVTVTRAPAKQQREPRVRKKAPAQHALSSASGTVALP